MNLYSYNKFSKSGKALADALGIKRIKHKGSRYKARARKVVINWGASTLPDVVNGSRIINNPLNVKLAANKLEFFKKLKDTDVSMPEFTTDKAIAQAWLDDGRTVVERHKLTGNSGEGIVICEPDGELGNAKMYTKYVPKKQEYRVHVFNGQVIDTQRKARVKEVADEDINWKVRNMDGGFIFARNEDHVVPDDVLTQGVNAVVGIGLDFGAVDVIYNEKEGKAYVLEVNTAPGLSGTTLDNYKEAFNG